MPITRRVVEMPVYGGWGVRFQSRLASCVILIVILWAGFGFAAPELHTLRSPDPKKTPCALYLTSIIDTTQGLKVADPSESSVRDYFNQKPSLAPKLVYLDRKTVKRLSDAETLAQKIKDKEAFPRVDRPRFKIVGTGPSWLDPQTRKLKGLVSSLLKEKYPDQKIKVDVIWRPTLPDYSSLYRQGLNPLVIRALERLSYGAQRIVYTFPLLQDFQKPTRGELRTMTTKLSIANGIRQVVIILVKKPETPLSSVVLGGLVDLGNSVGTGIWEKALSNWFNRTIKYKRGESAPLGARLRSEAQRWAKNSMLGSFFTMDLYWASRPEIWPLVRKTVTEGLSPEVRELFTKLKIGTLEGWKDFVKGQWGSLVFNLLWRHFLQQSIYIWESDYGERVNQVDARRTRNRLVFWSTIITTPGYLYGIIFPRWLSVHLFGYDVLHMNEGHFWMLFMGFVGSLYYWGVPDYDFSKKVWAPATWDPWVKRLDSVHEKVLALGKHLRIDRALDRIEELTRGSERDTTINGDVRTLIDIDPSVLKAIEHDPALVELIHKSPDLRALIESDPHFREFRDELLKDEVKKH